MTSVDPEPEPEVTSEPEIIPEPEVDFEGAWAEPEPDWPSAFSDWGVAWQLHVYIFASCFAIIFLLAALSLIYFFKNKQSLRQGKLTISLLFMLMLFTMLRGVAMFVDPYGTIGNVPGDYFRALWSLALPGLTASFSVLLLVLLDTTKMSLGPPRFQKLSTILIFTSFHFAIVIVSDVAFSLCKLCKGMLLFCQILFILYGALLAVGYMYSSIAIYKNCAAGNHQGNDSRKIIRLSQTAAAASAIAFTIFITNIYAASSEFGIYSDQRYVDAWHWWSLQTVLRLVEIVASCLILTIAFRNPCSGPTVNVVLYFDRKRTLPVTAKANTLTSESPAVVTFAATAQIKQDTSK